MTPQALALLVALADEVPENEDVVAGWTAFAVFIAMGIAVAILGFSLTKRLRNVERSEEEGRYDPSTRRSAPNEDEATDPGRPADDDPR